MLHDDDCFCCAGASRILQRPGPFAGVDAAFGGLGPTGNQIS